MCHWGLNVALRPQSSQLLPNDAVWEQPRSVDPSLGRAFVAGARMADHCAGCVNSSGMVVSMITHEQVCRDSVCFCSGLMS